MMGLAGDLQIKFILWVKEDIKRRGLIPKGVFDVKTNCIKYTTADQLFSLYDQLQQ